MIVTFSGMDGSGKSTLSTKLCENLEVKKVSCVKLELAGYYLLSNVTHLWQRKKSIGSKSNPYLLDVKKSPVLKIWPFFAFADDILRYFLVLKPLSRRKYVICDRYIYDKIIGFVHYGYLNKFIARLMIKLVPKPDRSYILEVIPEKALKREQGEKHKFKFYNRLSALYRELMPEGEYNYLDTSGKTAETLSRVIKDINI